MEKDYTSMLSFIQKEKKLALGYYYTTELLTPSYEKDLSKNMKYLLRKEVT